MPMADTFPYASINCPILQEKPSPPRPRFDSHRKQSSKKIHFSISSLPILDLKHIPPSTSYREHFELSNSKIGSREPHFHPTSLLHFLSLWCRNFIWRLFTTPSILLLIFHNFPISCIISSWSFWNVQIEISLIRTKFISNSLIELLTPCTWK